MTLAKLRILMPSIYFPPRVGGIESHVYYLARGLVERGHVVHVVTTRTEKSSPGTEVMDGIRVRRLPSFGMNFVGWTLGGLFSIPEVVRLARKHDIIHCHTFASGLSGSVASSVLGRPLIVTVHSSHFLRLSKKGFLRPPMRLLLKKASALLSTSKEIDGVVRQLLPHAFTLPIVNGIDTERFKPSQPALRKEQGEFLIVCPRRLVEKNGVEFLIRALVHLRGRLKPKVYIAGDGPLRVHLERVASEIGVQDQVVFMGSVDNNSMPSIYCSADLVVIPSLIEATSIAALEAMACERVVAAARVGGLPEIIDDRVGTLFEPGSPEAIADAIEKVAQQPDTIGAGKQARKRVQENWSISKVVDIHERLYQKLMEDADSA